MEEKEIRNGAVYGSDEKVVLPQEVTMVKIDNRDVELPVEALNVAGWHKVNADETVVKKVELSEEEAKFMECNKRLEFCRKSPNFQSEATDYTVSHVKDHEDEPKMYERLVRAYFCGYTVRETKYYIKFPEWVELDTWLEYLSVYSDGFWEFSTRTGGPAKRRFTQKEIDELQKDERATGLDLNALKVKVPDDELED